jgi:AcrR family transcriptional regulator
MTDQSTDTRNKIVEVARVLFAEQGFEGTSIREIAKEADVNLASVNYHFHNKENLFTEVLRHGYLECSTELRNFFNTQHPDLDSILLYLFRYFINKSHDLKCFFKMMLSSQHNHHLTAQGSEDELIGPPGGKVILESIINEVDRRLSEEDLFWALGTLFGNVIHTALMYDSCFKDNNFPYTSIEDLEKRISRLTKLVLEDLRNGTNNH